MLALASPHLCTMHSTRQRLSLCSPCVALSASASSASVRTWGRREDREILEIQSAWPWLALPAGEGEDARQEGDEARKPGSLP